MATVTFKRDFFDAFGNYYKKDHPFEINDKLVLETLPTDAAVAGLDLREDEGEDPKLPLEPSVKKPKL